MSIWYMLTVLLFLLILFEESIYYGWNRYLYGENIEMKEKWKKRIFQVISLLKRNKQVIIQQSDQEKSSS